MSLLKRISQTDEEPAPATPAPPPTSSLSSLIQRTPSPTSAEGANGSVPSNNGSAATPTEGPRTLRNLKRTQTADPFAGVKTKVQTMLAEETNRDGTVSTPAEIRKFIEQLLDTVLREDGLQATRADRARLLDAIAADALGFGPIQALLDDDAVTEIMVNGPHQIYIERGGKLTMSDVQFDSNDHVMRIIDRIVSPLGRRIDESSPYVDARLPDGSRVNAIIPPISLVGPVLTVRKFSRTPMTIDDLVRNNSSR